MSDRKTMMEEVVNRIHVDCGGMVVDDADFVSGSGGADEAWWNYRCSRCHETFQKYGEWKEPDE